MQIRNLYKKLLREKNLGSYRERYDIISIGKEDSVQIRPKQSKKSLSSRIVLMNPNMILAD